MHQEQLLGAGCSHSSSQAAFQAHPPSLLLAALCLLFIYAVGLLLSCCRRRHAYATKSNRTRVVKTPGELQQRETVWHRWRLVPVRRVGASAGCVSWQSLRSRRCLRFHAATGLAADQAAALLLLLLLLRAPHAGGKLVLQTQKKPTKHARCGATGVILHGVSGCCCSWRAGNRTGSKQRARSTARRRRDAASTCSSGMRLKGARLLSADVDGEGSRLCRHAPAASRSLPSTVAAAADASLPAAAPLHLLPAPHPCVHSPRRLSTLTQSYYRPRSCPSAAPARSAPSAWPSATRASTASTAATSATPWCVSALCAPS